MVQVTGSRGRVVSINMTGINGVVIRMRLQRKQIENATDLGVVKAGAFIEDEVKESIIGKRAEPKSVDTGRLGNSIQFNKTGTAIGIVAPKKSRYPGGSNTVEVANLLEFGTSRILPRRHFRNTEKRNKKKIQEIIKKEVDLAIQQRVRIGLAALKALKGLF